MFMSVYVCVYLHICIIDIKKFISMICIRKYIEFIYPITYIYIYIYIYLII